MEFSGRPTLRICKSGRTVTVIQVAASVVMKVAQESGFAWTAAAGTSTAEQVFDARTATRSIRRAKKGRGSESTYVVSAVNQQEAEIGSTVHLRAGLQRTELWLNADTAKLK